MDVNLPNTENIKTIVVILAQCVTLLWTFFQLKSDTKQNKEDLNAIRQKHEADLLTLTEKIDELRTQIVEDAKAIAVAKSQIKDIQRRMP